MKKNLKVCVEEILDSERQLLVDMNDYDLILASGMEPDLRHRRTAHMTGAWRFAKAAQVCIPLGGADLSGYRFLSLAVFSVGGAGGEFQLRFDSSSEKEQGSGFECILPIEKDGWNEYRIELPLLRAVRSPAGWDRIDSITLDSVAGGVCNRPTTVLYVDSVTLAEQLSPLYCRMPELKGAAVFARSGKYAIVDRKRVLNTPDAAEARPFEGKDGMLWLPMAPVAAVLCRSAVVDTKAYTLSFTYRRKKYCFSATSKEVTVNGVAEPLGFFPVVQSGCLFFPADYVREFFRWRQIFTDPTGLIILSNRRAILDRSLQGATIRRLVLDLTCERPDSRAVLEDLHRTISNPNRSRLLVSQETLLQLRRDAKSDETLKGYVAALKERFGTRSAAYAAAPYSAEEDVSSEALALVAERTVAFTTLYRFTGDKVYCERVAAECEALATHTSWSLTASHDVAVIAFAVALAYDWCHHVWSEARKATVERALLRNALRPALEIYEGRGQMWHPGSALASQMHCGFLAAALALADIYPETVNRLIKGILPAVEVSFENFSPDGGYAEGIAGWERAARSCALIVAMLETACASSYGLASAPGFAATAYFPIMTSGRDAVWNFHGAPEIAADTSILPFFALRYADPTLRWLRQRQIADRKVAVDPLDLVFYRPIEEEILPELPLDAVYRRAGIAVMRSDWSTEATFFGLHAGSNHVLHGDLDAGSFLLEMGGERFFCEMGGEAGLPMLLTRRAEGQNTLIIDPVPAPAPDQAPDAIASFLEMRSAPERAYVVADLSSISDKLIKAKRGILLEDGRHLAVIQDELTLESPGCVAWGAYTDAAVLLSPGGRAVKLQKNGKTLLCRLSGVASPARFTAVPVEGSRFTRLCVTVEASERVRMAVACRLVDENASFAEKLYEIKPISRWGYSET